MDDRFNTIAGWLLGGGIVLLGGMLVSGEIFSHERPATMGYEIEGVEQEAGGAAAEQPIAAYLQTADAGRGERVFAKCTACHTINQGGANGIGPNLHGVMGEAIAASSHGFAFSEALRGRGSETWTWENMSEWLRSPRQFAPGTKMTFAGLSDPQDRADILLYMNGAGGRLQVPPPPAAAPAEGNASGEAGAVGNDAATATTAAPADNAAAPTPEAGNSQ